jgi:hypothetical protein
MSDSDVRIRRPLEGNERRRINIVAWGLGILFLAVAGLTYWLTSEAGEHGISTRTVSRYPNMVIYEQGPAGGRAQRIVVKQREDGVPFVELLDARSADDYASQTLEITDGPVVDVIGDRVFTVGPSRKEAILVHIDQPTDCLQWFKPGQRVQINGGVKNMPDRSMLKKWGVTDDEKGLAGKRGVYIEATNVNILDPDPEQRDGC